MSCEHTDHYNTSCKDCIDETYQIIIAGLPASMAAQDPNVAPSRQLEPISPPPPTEAPYNPIVTKSDFKFYKHRELPDRALVRFPTHPSDVLKLLSDI